MSLGLLVATIVNYTDNNRAKILYTISVKGIGARLNRLPSACVGDMVIYGYNEVEKTLALGRWCFHKCRGNLVEVVLPTSSHGHFGYLARGWSCKVQVINKFRSSESRDQSVQFWTMIVQDENSHLHYSQLPWDAKASAIKEAPSRTTGKGRDKYEMRQSLKDEKVEASILKENTSNISEIFKTFSTEFIWLNGILFTRTSLETFEEVLLMVKNDLLELLFFGFDEKYSFGSDAADFRLEIVKLVSNLIFTIHNAIMGSDNPQTLVSGSTLGEHGLYSSWVPCSMMVMLHKRVLETGLAMAGGISQPNILLLDRGFVRLLWVCIGGVSSGVSLDIGIGIRIMPLRFKAYKSSFVPTEDNIDEKCSTYGIHTQFRGPVPDCPGVPPVPSSPP
ncbi:60S ribosomal protein L23 [Capsicum baccatum]|uniref:60S ribosomal protein L23 n=1 Tax=Capsicum baccatum TaxID=33114 RepID=A0A2G2XBR7_CAPBA|nr:60S ribosomal protein L23 [Capsicum baccatum]